MSGEAQQLSFAGIEPAAKPKHGLFFAFRPTAAAVESIEALVPRLRAAHRLSGRAIDGARLHVTLHHIGDFVDMPHAVIYAAGRAAAAMNAPPFEIAFDRVGSFHGQPGKLPFVLLGDEGVDGVVVFQQALCRMMAQAGLAHRAKAAFMPHVTLMYGDRELKPEPIVPVRWTAHEFVLVESLIGESRHVVLGRWPLVG